ncbi:TPA: diphthine synthase [Candidatus Woesearchaeota archaeon]|nr:diphthine synthase [Candidatus Woesearchaeota archaeon]HIH12996.1 diphthine synthase [Candidatus Woesearchaeota archaeon]
MTLYVIGIGLADEKDISVKGLEIVKKCEKIYVENYTSLLQCSHTNLEKFYGKKIIPAPRELSEQGAEKIVQEAKKKNIAFLIIGDPFSATTHIELFKLAKENKVPVKVIHNASILTAVGITGLQLYKFGKTTSIPFIEEYPNVETPYNIFRENNLLGSHTLFLLDLKPDQNKFMTIHNALEILETIESRKKENFIKENMLVIGCARLGADDFMIKAGALKDVKNMDFGKPPHCLIIPGKLHFLEEEMLKVWK